MTDSAAVAGDMTLADILTSASKEDAIDERSHKGQFGWFALGKSYVPMIYRNGCEEYCAVKMAEQAALACFLKSLNKDIFNCVSVKSYYCTPVEANLLNQINFGHCDGQFGKDHFSNQLLIRVSDAKDFFEFLRVCYSKLVGKDVEGESGKRLGFVIINHESVVPYAVSNGRKYVPLFYFEGEIEQLKLKSYKLEGWDLSYLKFCCKMQGIKNQLFNHETCSVIDLSDITNYFPPETSFEEYWPTKIANVQLLSASKGHWICGEWTKLPPAPQFNQQQQQQAGRGNQQPQQQQQMKTIATYSNAGGMNYRTYAIPPYDSL